MTEQITYPAMNELATAAQGIKRGGQAIMSFWKPVKPFVSPFIMNKKPAKSVTPINVEQLAATTMPAFPLSILVVEDNKVNRVLTIKMLNHLGFTADAVNNGRECVEALAGKKYDLFLMDLQMPEMDGFTAAREIRRWNLIQAANPPPYICALTANVMEKDREECRAAGMDDFLTKPLRMEALKIVVSRVAENLKNFYGLSGQ